MMPTIPVMYSSCRLSIRETHLTVCSGSVRRWSCRLGIAVQVRGFQLAIGKPVASKPHGPAQSLRNGAVKADWIKRRLSDRRGAFKPWESYRVGSMPFDPGSVAFAGDGGP